MCKKRIFVSKPATILTITLFFSSTVLFGQNHFSGFAGVAGNVGAGDDDKFHLTTDAFFAGQFDLLGIVLLRAGATVRTSNLFSSEVFNRVPASFTLDELSITARFPCCHATRYVSLFAGEYESIGSDTFLRRHFGILPTGARFLEKRTGFVDTPIHTYSNLGASYILKLKTPQAFGLYFYANERDTQTRGSVDLRFAGVFPIVTLDFSAGIGFPIKTKEPEDKTSNPVTKSIEFHGGFSTLIGDHHTASLFLQLGVTKAILNPAETEKALQLSDTYFLLEPRFKVKSMNFHFALFNLPKETVQDLFFISNSVGCNLAIFADNIYSGVHNITFGAHITVSAKDISLDNFNSLTDKNLSFRVSPFVETPLHNGTLMSRLTMDFMEITRLHKTMKFTVGYKTKL